MSSTFRPATTTDAEHDWKEVFNFPTATSSTSVWSAFPHPSQSSWTISLNQEPPRVVPRGLRQSANAEDVLSEFSNFKFQIFSPLFFFCLDTTAPTSTLPTTTAWITTDSDGAEIFGIGTPNLLSPISHHVPSPPASHPALPSSRTRYSHHTHASPTLPLAATLNLCPA